MREMNSMKLKRPLASKRITVCTCAPPPATFGLFPKKLQAKMAFETLGLLLDIEVLLPRSFSFLFIHSHYFKVQKNRHQIKLLDKLFRFCTI